MDYLDIEKMLLPMFFILIIMSGIGLAILCILLLESSSNVNALNSSLETENYYGFTILSLSNMTYG